MAAGWDYNTWYGSATGTYYPTSWTYTGGYSAPMTVKYEYEGPVEGAPPPPVAPAPESPMDWLRRRAEEITDLAYAGV